MIYLNHIYFDYNGRDILQNVDLRLQAGHIYGLLGENGAGKSTLLKCISGAVFPRSGAVRVNGFQPKKRQSEFLSQVFFLPEEFSLPSLSIPRYMNLYASFYPKFDEKLFHRLLEEFEVPQHAHLDRLSYGQKKKVFISFGIATQTRILLMDEPTNGLDIPSKSQFRRIIASVLTEDRCFLISTHQVRDLDSLIDHLIILKDHRVVMSDSIAHIGSQLSFQLSREVPENAFYSEHSIGGIHSITRNTSGEEGATDMELFFKAMLLNEKELTSVFEHQPKKQ